MVALHYSMLHRFEIFSAPGTIVHGSIRLPRRREAVYWQLESQYDHLAVFQTDSDVELFKNYILLIKETLMEM